MAKKKPGIGDTRIAPTPERKAEAVADDARLFSDDDINGRSVAKIDDAQRTRNRVFLLTDRMYGLVKKLAGAREARRKAAGGIIKIDGKVKDKRISPSTLVRELLAEYLERHRDELE